MPGGRCGPHTNQMAQSAISDATSQMMKIRSPWPGSRLASRAASLTGGGGAALAPAAIRPTTCMLPVMYPMVCMGPPNPSRKPPPHGTRHCQK